MLRRRAPRGYFLEPDGSDSLPGGGAQLRGTSGRLQSQGRRRGVARANGQDGNLSRGRRGRLHRRAGDAVCRPRLTVVLEWPRPASLFMKKYFMGLFGAQREIEKKLAEYLDETEAITLELQKAIACYLKQDGNGFASCF